MRFSRAQRLPRAALEKFAGAWLACILVMSRGNFADAFTIEHIQTAFICGVVGAAVAVALLAQMDLRHDGALRQATVSALVTFIGDVFSRISYLSPHWLEPLMTATISAGLALVYWYIRQKVTKHIFGAQDRSPA